MEDVNAVYHCMKTLWWRIVMKRLLSLRLVRTEKGVESWSKVCSCQMTLCNAVMMFIWLIRGRRRRENDAEGVRMYCEYGFRISCLFVCVCQMVDKSSSCGELCMSYRRAEGSVVWRTMLAISRFLAFVMDKFILIMWLMDFVFEHLLIELLSLMCDE